MSITLDKRVCVSPRNPIYIGLKLLSDVAVFRLKRLEMANLFAAVSIMAGLALPLADAGFRFSFGILLNLLVYLNNDYCDVVQDIKSDAKDLKKALLLHQYKSIAFYTQIFLIVVLAVVGAAYSRGLVLTLVVAGGVCWLYSSLLKRIAYLDVVAMLIAGMAMPLVGMPLDSLLGWCLVIQLGLFSACFQSIQIIRDHREDVASGVRTTAVCLGVNRTVFLLRVFIVLSSLYGILVLHFLFGLLPLVALFIPLHREDAKSYWNRIRLIMGLSWIGIIGWLFWYQSSAGALISIDSHQTIEWLKWWR